MNDNIELQWLDPKILKPYKKNAKLHSDNQVSQIADQMSAFGFDVPIVVDKNMVIIKGHGRRLAALKLNLDKVPVIISNLDRNAAIAARLGDNKIASASPWDNEMLKAEIQELQLNAEELIAFTGFDTNEIQSLLMEWESDISTVSKTEEHLEGIQSWIKVKCPKDLRDTLKDFLQHSVNEQGFEGVTIE
jgi:ParB-like chromosome segregation protein Spo0J